MAALTLDFTSLFRSVLFLAWRSFFFAEAVFGKLLTPLKTLNLFYHLVNQNATVYYENLEECYKRAI